jgi:hypothetical protein
MEKKEVKERAQKVLDTVGQEKILAILENKEGLLVKPETFKDSLDLFRAEVGKENFDVLASGPNLVPMMDKWQSARTKKNMDVLLQRIKKECPAEIDDQDVVCFLLVAMDLV